MKGQFFETLVGAGVLAAGIGFIVFASSSAGVGGSTGYPVSATFDRIDGISAGTDVRIAGVTVGRVEQVALNEETYLADVTLTIRDSVQLPDDTVALVDTEGLLGGQYIALQPGGSPDFIATGGRITFTQSAPSLQSLLGQVIFSGGGEAGGSGNSASGSGDADETANSDASPSPFSLGLD